MRWCAVGLLTGCLLSLMGCGEDTLWQVCVSTEGTFDIEEVSVLEDAMGLPSGHDAVIVDYDTSELPEGASWRVASVDVLMMIPAASFESYSNEVKLAIEVFDAASPVGQQAYVVEQTLDKTSLTWEDVTLTNPQETWDLQQKRAWWTFDFSDAIAETGMSSTTFVAGVYWKYGGAPTVGYSNYNRPCDRNWTDYGDGTGWVLNSERDGGVGLFDPNSCNFPMLRVNVEVREEGRSCGP